MSLGRAINALIRRHPGELGLTPHIATTRHLAGAWPWQADRPLPSEGILYGTGQDGELIALDPYWLYAHANELGLAFSSPSVTIAGIQGSGKSAARKVMIRRHVLFGRLARSVGDIKGENRPLVQDLDGSEIELYPGGPHRINMLDAHTPNASPDDVRRERAAVCRQVITLGRASPPLAREEEALDVALRSLQSRHDHPVVAHLTQALLNPEPDELTPMTKQQLRRAGETLAYELRQLCSGPLGGMFDAPTNVQLDATYTSFNTRRLEHDPQALRLATILTTAWLRRDTARGDGKQRIIDVDEMWNILREPHAARAFQEADKFNRLHGVMRVFTTQFLSDADTAGDAGSQTVAIAKQLLATSGIVILFRLPNNEVNLAAHIFDLNEAERAIVPHLSNFECLVKIGDERFVCRTELSPYERTLTRSDHAMIGEATPR